MATGTQMMLEAAIKMILSHMKIDPEMVKSEVARIRQIMAEHQATQAAIVADLAAIKTALKIKTPECNRGGQNHERIGSGQSGNQGIGAEDNGAGKLPRVVAG